MHRIDSATAEIDKFGAGKNGYTEGTPGVTPATETTDDALDAFQEEIIAPIEGMGITLAKGTRDQLYTAIQRMIHLSCLSNWTRRGVGDLKDVVLYDVAYDSVNNLFCAVGAQDGADSYILTSYDDGQTWTERAPTVPKAIDLNAVAHNGTNLWCAVGGADGTDAYILTSADGTTWTERAPTVSKNITLNAVAFADSIWVAVGAADGTDSYILTSPDGITWTERAPTVSKNLNLFDVAYDSVNDLWTAVGAVDGTGPYILTSSDGITWTEREMTSPKAFNLLGVAHDQIGTWVAVGAADGTDPLIITSADGTTWTERAMTNPVNDSLWDVAFKDGVWIAVGENDDGTSGLGLILSSIDGGITWKRRAYPEALKDFCDLYGIAFGDDMAVIVGLNDGVADSTINTSLRTPF